MSYFEDQAIPIGFGMALAMNLDAMENFSNLSEAEKEELLNRAKDAKSKNEMQQIIAKLNDNKTF